MKKIHNFFNFPFAQKKVIFEGIFYSFWFELCIKFNWHTFTVDLQKNRGPKFKNGNDDPITLAQIEKGINVLKKYAPWRPLCHNLALTAKVLFNKRNINTMIHVGFKKNKDKEIKGHAWLTHCDRVVVGQLKDLSDYQELS